ncbi:MAG: thiolase domain-containing protein [Rhizomicrobium sp.]
MSIKGKAYVMGAFEHPTREAPDKSTPQLHAECMRGALADAGLTKDDIDGYFCAGDAPGFGALSMADYLGAAQAQPCRFHRDRRLVLYPCMSATRREAIAAGKCSVALITLAGKPRTSPPGGGPRGSGGFRGGAGSRLREPLWRLDAQHLRHVRGGATCTSSATTSEQLAWIKVAASHHAQWNPHAFLKDVVTVEDVVNSPMIATPLHRLDCCVVTDGGGALIVTSPEVAKRLNRPRVKVIGAGEAPKGTYGGKVDLTFSGAAWSGPKAFAEAGVTPADIKYASIYDSFTITVLMQLEDLGFCAKGKGGAFVADGNLISGVGKLPFNTDGGGLCNNHPTNRGGITKVIEAVRQLRGEAHPKVQVKNCDLAIAHGTGGSLGTRHGSATLIMERE